MVSMMPKSHLCIQSSSLLPRFSSFGSLAGSPASAGAAAASPSAGSASAEGASSAACPHTNKDSEQRTFGVPNIKRCHVRNVYYRTGTEQSTWCNLQAGGMQGQ